MSNSTKYDLEDRMLTFSKNLLAFLKKLPDNTVNFKLVDQCTRAGTSIGANYCEANEVDTKKDFQYRIGICRKESKETAYWLKIISEVNDNIEDEINLLLQESKEFIKIFSSMTSKNTE